MSRTILCTENATPCRDDDDARRPDVSDCPAVDLSSRRTGELLPNGLNFRVLFADVYSGRFSLKTELIFISQRGFLSFLSLRSSRSWGHFSFCPGKLRARIFRAFERRDRKSKTWSCRASRYNESTIRDKTADPRQREEEKKKRDKERERDREVAFAIY